MRAVGAPAPHFTVRAGGRVRTEELHVRQLGVQVAQAVGHHLVGEVALEVDDEAVVARGRAWSAGTPAW